jgi:vacuolar-type H+-ATPase subunit I/STV1
MTDQEAIGGNQPPADDKSGASANPSEPESDDIDFTPEQKRKLGKILSAERNKVREQFKDYEELKTKLKEIEKSKLTEAQQLQLERDEAKKEAEALKKKVEKLGAVELRTKLFSDFKTKAGDSLPSHLLKYVSGKDEETITKSIESIANDFGLKLEKKKNIGNQIPPGTNDPQNKHGFINSMIMGAAGRGGR